MAAAGCKGNTFFPRILYHLDHIVLTTWIDNSEVCRTLVLSEAQISLVKLRLVLVEWQMNSRFAGELLLKIAADCVCQ